MYENVTVNGVLRPLFLTIDMSYAEILKEKRKKNCRYLFNSLSLVCVLFLVLFKLQDEINVMRTIRKLTNNA